MINARRITTNTCTLYTGVWAGQSLMVVITGIGKSRVLASLSSLDIDNLSSVTYCLSLGVCGALDSNYAIGSVFASDIFHYQADVIHTACVFSGFDKVSNRTVDIPLGIYDGSYTESIVQMEDYWYAEWAVYHGYAFNSLRAVSDIVGGSSDVFDDSVAQHAWNALAAYLIGKSPLQCN